jgi:hypothetical protein
MLMSTSADTRDSMKTISATGVTSSALTAGPLVTLTDIWSAVHESIVASAEVATGAGSVEECRFMLFLIDNFLLEEEEKDNFLKNSISAILLNLCMIKAYL